jgi:hypothetical protein
MKSEPTKDSEAINLRLDPNKPEGKFKWLCDYTEEHITGSALSPGCGMTYRAVSERPCTRQ